MKGLTLAVLALCAASASARVVILAKQSLFHTDQWCQDHHLGEGPSTCILHEGCCYDGRIGACHSCDSHSDEWCTTYGGSDALTCVGFSGCTMSYPDGPDELGLCVSNSDPDVIEDNITCEEQMVRVDECVKLGGEVDYNVDGKSDDRNKDTVITVDDCDDPPECDDNGEYFPEQTTVDGFIYCVSEQGHTIPDTKAKEAAFKSRLTNCRKEQKKHKGMQCPNAVTLATGNGEVMINDHPDVGNCDMTLQHGQGLRRRRVVLLQRLRLLVPGPDPPEGRLRAPHPRAVRAGLRRGHRARHQGHHLLRGGLRWLRRRRHRVQARLVERVRP